MAFFVQIGLAFGVAAVCTASTPGFADHQPGIVMPLGRGAPPLIDGYDATGAIIEGDWGLYRPGHGAVTFYPNGGLLPAATPPAHYFPRTGRRPGYGRYEIEPPANRRRPPPAPSYHRTWSTESGSSAVTTYPSYEPPSVIVAAPPDRRDKRRLPRKYRPPVR